MNTMRAAVLLAAMTGLFLVVGYFIGGERGMLMALLLAAGVNAFAYWNSDKMVLRMYGAREVDRASAPAFYGIIENLAQRANLPMPRVYIIDSPQPNAFATGRDPQHAAVAASTGLLDMLDAREIAGVMAHELTHVRNRDTLVMTITATLAGAIGYLAHFAFFFGGNRDRRDNPLGPIGGILVMILAPIAAMLVQLAISRSREYGADEGGADISGDPLALASALAKIERGAEVIPNPAAESNPATAHMFIVNPLAGAGFQNMFRTHPSTAERIARLQAMAHNGGEASAFVPDPRSSTPTGGQRTARRRGPWD